MGYLEIAKQVEKRLMGEGKIPVCESKPQAMKQAWKAFRYVDGRPLPLTEAEISRMTVMEIVNGPFVLKFDLPKQGEVYFIGLDDDLYRDLTSEGKTTRWLHELFQGIQDKLGVPSIYRWTLGRMWSTQAGLDVFKGAKVEVRE